MGLILSIGEIHDHLAEHELLTRQVKDTLVYAQVMPSVAQYLLLSSYAMLINGAYFVMALQEDRIVIIPLNKITGKIDKKLAPIFIPHDELVEVTIKKGKIMDSITFSGEDQELTVKISKIIMGMSWHKENIGAFMAGIQTLAWNVGRSANEDI